MKFAYVLISSPEDYLGEKTIISLYSFRRHNNNDVVIFTDKQTVESIPGTIERLKNLGADMKVETLPPGLSQMQRSRFLKTSIRQRVKGDFVFLDLDTVIVGDLSEIESIECDMAIALQHDCMDNNHEAAKKRIMRYNTLRNIKKTEMHGIKTFFNSGVILYKDTPLCHKLGEEWHKAWFESSTKYGWHKDQADLDIVNVAFNNKIKILDGKFNCQLVGFRFAMKHLSDCKILHYMNNPSKLSYLKVKQSAYLNKVRESLDFKMLDNTIDSLKEEYVKGLSIMEHTQLEALKQRKEMLQEIVSRSTHPIKYPLSKIIDRYDFLRRTVDLLKGKKDS